MLESDLTAEEIAERLVGGLNPEQARAVRTTEGAVLVLAGAGSGKTRALTVRIAWLVAHLHVPASRILAVTFTNKAAGEMRERTEALLRPLGVEPAALWVGTFHSICLRLLRMHADRIGFGRDFSIWDTGDQQSQIRKIIKQVRGASELKPSYVRRLIDGAKNKLLSPEEWLDHDPEAEPRVALVYRRYQEQLKLANAVDFNDLIGLTVRLFKENDDLRERYRERFRYMMVDEYQDTNGAQYELIRQMAGPQGNLCVVGDDDQSIYGFRGADISNILNFEKDYPAATVIRLEQNYRSTGAILDAANAVVARNTRRRSKRLWTEKERGQLIRVQECADDQAEAAAAISIVRKLRSQGMKLSDIAIFYRTNGQSRPLEEQLMAHRLEFQLVGGQRFYERADIKNMMAWLKLLSNPANDAALTRIINVPARGIGAKSIERLAAEASDSGRSMLATARDLVARGERWAARLGSFTTLVEDLARRAEALAVPQLIETVIDRTGYDDMLGKLDAFEAANRRSTLQELVNSTSEYADYAPADGLARFLDRASLVADTDQIPSDEEQGKVTLMTIHCAKGLEYPAVVLVGMDEGLFPHSRSADDEKELEEERRLCYVAITRAQRLLYVLRARRRLIHGRPSVSRPSRFLSELPPELVLRTGSSMGRSLRRRGPARSRRDDGSEIVYDEEPARRGPLFRSQRDYEPGQAPRMSSGIPAPASPAMRQGRRSLAGRRGGRPAPARSARPERTARTVRSSSRPSRPSRSVRGGGSVDPDAFMVLEGTEARPVVGGWIRHPRLGVGRIQSLDGGRRARAVVDFDGKEETVLLGFTRVEFLRPR